MRQTRTTTAPFRRSTYAAAPNAREAGNPHNWRFWLVRTTPSHIDEPETDAKFVDRITLGAREVEV